MDLQTLFWLTLALGAGAISKGATGLGLPLIALPLLTALVGLQQAIGIMLVPIIVTNLYQIWAYRAARAQPGLAFLPWFLGLGAVGIGLGTWALDTLPERTLEAGLGAMLLAYVALRLARPGFVLSQAAGRRLGPVAGLAAGTLQGATGIAAPAGVTFIHALGLERRATVFAVSAMFLGFAMVQLPALIIAGIYQAHWLWLGLFACIPVFVFMPVGAWLGRISSPRAFDLMILAFLTLAGARMVIGA